MKIVIVLGGLMFDVNLLNSPGIQNNLTDKITSNKSNNQKVTSQKNTLKKSSIKNNNVQKFSGIILLLIGAIIIFSLFKYNFLDLDRIIPNKRIESYDYKELLSKLKKYENQVIFNSIKFSKDKISMELRLLDSTMLYEILDDFSNVLYDNTKAYRSNNNSIVDIDIPWKINENSSFNINLLDKELSDVNPGLKKELYKDKLIIIANSIDFLEFIEFLLEINIIKNFHINIEPIKSVPNTMKLYKIIVY